MVGAMVAGRTALPRLGPSTTLSSRTAPANGRIGAAAAVIDRSGRCRAVLRGYGVRSYAPSYFGGFRKPTTFLFGVASPASSHAPKPFSLARPNTEVPPQSVRRKHSVSTWRRSGFSGGGDSELSEDRSVSRQWTLGNSPQSRLIAKQRRFNHRAIPAVAALIRPIAGKVLMLDPALSLNPPMD